MSDKGNPNILVSTQVYSKTEIRIAREITEPCDFADELNAIKASGPGDIIEIELITPGGLLSTAKLFERALTLTEAHTKCFIGMEVSSAGTVIALSCDEWEVDDDSSFMIHAPSYGTSGKFHEVMASNAHNFNLISALYRRVYAGFLTEDEISQCLAGADFWFHGDALISRLAAYSEHRARQGEEKEVDMPVIGE